MATRRSAETEGARTPPPLWRRRGLWAALAVVTYPALAAATSRAWAPIEVAGLSAIVVAVVVVFAVTTADERSSTGPVDDALDDARAALRATWSGALATAATLLAAPSPWTTALRNTGLAIASIAAVVSVARVPRVPSALEVPAGARGIGPAFFLAFVWSIAVALPGFVAFSTDPELVPAAVLSAAAVSASLASTVVLTLTAIRTVRLRRLELTVRERLALPIALGAVGLVAAIVAATVGLAHPEWAALTALLASCIVTSTAASARSANAIGASARFVTVVIAPAIALALATAFVATRFPKHAASAAVGAVTGATLLGVFARRLGDRASRPSAEWLAAIEGAGRAALSPDPEPALERALAALAHKARGSVRLFLSTDEVMIAAWAGQVRRDAGSFPAAVAAAAEREHLGVLRRDAAAEAGVRDLSARAAAQWMVDRGVDIAVRVAEDDTATGLLAFAMPGRSGPLTIAEAEALRALADRIGAVVAVLAKLKRSWERERVTRAGSEELAANLVTAERQRTLAGRASDDLVERLARDALVANYSAAARLVLDELGTWAKTPGPHLFTLIGALGVRAVPWAAAFHRAERRAGRPFVVVESGSTHPGAPDGVNDLDFWRDSDVSPLVRARGGTLVLHDPQLLHKLVQSYISVALPPDTNVILLATHALDVLVARDELEERFAAKVGDRVLVLPVLSERPEDLRALVLAQLAEIGARHRGAPLAIEPSALGILVEHPWPGNDAELVGVLTAASARCEDGKIRARDVVSALVETSAVEKRRDAGTGAAKRAGGTAKPGGTAALSARDEERSYRATSGLDRPPRTRRAR